MLSAGVVGDDATVAYATVPAGVDRWAPSVDVGGRMTNSTGATRFGKADEPLRRLAIGSMATVLLVLLFFLSPQVIDGGASLFVERLVAGLDRGAVYATVAVALMLVFATSSFLNVAQGQLAMLGAFLAYILAVPREVGLAGGRATALDHVIGPLVGWDGFALGPLPLGLIGAIAVGIAGSAVLGLVIEWLLRPFGRGDDLPPTLVTLGLFAICGSLATWLWEDGPRPFPNLFPDGSDDHLGIGGVEVPWDTIGTFVVLGAAGVAAHHLLADGRLTRPRAWVASSALGTLAAIVVAPELFLSPQLMVVSLAYALAAVVAGGFGTLRRTAAAGVGAGVVETVVVGYLADIDSAFSALSLPVAFGAIAMVLWLRGPTPTPSPTPAAAGASTVGVDTGAASTSGTPSPEAAR